MAPKLTVRFAAGQFGSAGDAAHTVERSSSKAARGCEQLPRALPDAAAAPVLAFEQGAGQPAQGEAPEAITSSRAAAGVSAPSESDPRRATRCVARRVRPSEPNISAENPAASTKHNLQLPDSLAAATLRGAATRGAISAAVLDRRSRRSGGGAMLDAGAKPYPPPRLLAWTQTE